MTKITAVFTKSSPVLIFQIKKWKQRFNSFSLHILFLKVLLISLDSIITRPILYAKKYVILTGIAMRAIRT